MKKSWIFVVLSVSLGACAGPFLNLGNPTITRVAGDTDFSHVRALAYMGGSIYYNPEDPSGSPVVPGASVAFRLGRVEQVQLENDRSVFKDMGNRANFGVLEIEAVDTSRMRFHYAVYTSAGEVAYTGQGSLSTGETFDIDRDGVQDIDYTSSLTSRPGFANARYLNFRSSRDDRTTAMFAVIPAQYPRGEYPNGVLGINPDGRFIVNRYEVVSKSRAAFRGIARGDFILDSQSGRYLRVLKASASALSRAVTADDLDTIDASIAVNFRFSVEEFGESRSATDLLRAIPYQARGSIENTLDDNGAVIALNGLLEDRGLLARIHSVQPVPIPDDALSAVLASLPSLSSEQVVQLNRILLEKTYSALCPAVENLENPLSEILPLLACEIRNSDATGDSSTTATDLGQGARSVGTAKNPTEYEAQRTAIEKKWAEYKQIFTFDLGPNGGKITNVIYDFLVSGEPQKIMDAAGALLGYVSSAFMGKTPPQPATQPGEQMQVYPVGSDGSVKAEDQTPAMVLQNTFKTDMNGKIPGWNDYAKSFANPTQTWKMSVGLYGTFKISWGNIEGGLAVAVFMQADTKFIASASYTKRMGISGGGELSMTQPTTVSLSLGSLPPIQIGVVSLTFALNGGFNVPIDFGASMDMSMGLRIAFTGLYGAEVRAGVNYGVKMSTVRIGWWDVSVPTGGYANMYGSGSVINETAFYLGPSDFVLSQSIVPWVDSAGVYIAVTPSIYIEPRIVLNGTLWIGVRGTVGDMRRLDIKTKNVKFESSNLTYPTIYGELTTKPIVSLDATYGATVTIPVVNWQWSPSGSTTIWKSDLPPVVEKRF